MINRYSNTVLPFILIFVTCILQVRLADANSTGSEISPPDAVNYVVFVEGTVSLKRQGWSAYVPVTFGTPLYSGDLLRVNEGSRSKVVCSDLSLREIMKGISGVPCTAPGMLLLRPNGSRIRGTRLIGISPGTGWSNSGSGPVVLSPRKTKLFSFHPLLRWTPVAGASVYTVTVRGLKLNWGAQVKGATEISYPDDAPRLEPGVDYKVVVEAEGRSSSAEPGTGLGFSLLESTERKAVTLEEKRLQSLGLPEGPTQFLVAQLYAAHELNAEAIERLERISETFKVGAVARSLANLYLTVGLARQAEARYLDSIRLATGEQDEEGLMLSHMALADIYEKSVGNSKLATQHLEEALVIATKMGDVTVAGAVERRLAHLRTVVLR